MTLPTRVSNILEDVAAERGVAVRDLLGSERRRYIAHPRQEAWSRIYALGAYSLPQIGGWFYRDHTTVLAGIRAHEKRMAEGRS